MAYAHNHNHSITKTASVAVPVVLIVTSGNASYERSFKTVEAARGYMSSATRDGLTVANSQE